MVLQYGAGADTGGGQRSICIGVLAEKILNKNEEDGVEQVYEHEVTLLPDEKICVDAGWDGGAAGGGSRGRGA